MTVILYCTGKGTHPPVGVYGYNGALPFPDDWEPYGRKTELDLHCDRGAGGCGRSPRPGRARLRELIEDAAATPGTMLDVSYLDL